jgi:hypothetical protein
MAAAGRPGHPASPGPRGGGEEEEEEEEAEVLHVVNPYCHLSFSITRSTGPWALGLMLLFQLPLQRPLQLQLLLHLSKTG